jgi:hypothetical protein
MAADIYSCREEVKEAKLTKCKHFLCRQPIDFCHWKRLQHLVSQYYNLFENPCINVFDYLVKLFIRQGRVLYSNGLIRN